MSLTDSRQIQTQTQQQVQTLSPQQILVVKLVELPAVELEDRVRAELLENPALEEGRTDDEQSDVEADMSEDQNNDYDELKDYLTEDDVPDYKLHQNNGVKENIIENIPFSASVSFYESLKNQLDEQDLDDEQKDIAIYIIGSLDDDGFLRKSLQSISDELAIYSGIDVEENELEEILSVVQSLDPAGIGARSLQESLLIQIDRKGQEENQNALLLDTERSIIEECYEEFTHKHWDKIIKRLNLDEELFDRAMNEIIHLNPKPGASLGEEIGKNMQQIVPDFIVETLDDGSLNITLNNANVPVLNVNQQFMDMYEATAQKSGAKRSSSNKDAFLFLKQKLDSAKNFISAIEQRQKTLMKTMQAIVQLQHDFFIQGDESLLKPMVLKDVAELTHLDISTISRVSNSKYVQTNFGLYALKYFFNEGYTTNEGEEMSVRNIKYELLELVKNEDKSHPLTDDQLAQLLKEKGYPIARRTVAKYRLQLDIPVARLRR